MTNLFFQLRQGRKKGQAIALSMLTRFAMVFFIMSLAVIVLLFSNSEQKGLCQTQAELTARQMAASINQVLTSPAEDERKVVPLVVALSVGAQDRASYTVNLTDRVDTKTIVIGVTARSADCTAFQSVGYGDANVVFQTSHSTTASSDPHQYQEVFGASTYPGLHLTPSDTNDRTSYLIVLKCKDKSTFNGLSYLYLQNCNYVFPGATGVDPKNCLQLQSTDPNVPDVSLKCGFT